MAENGSRRTPAERRLAGAKGAHQRWAREPDRTAATAKARAAANARFLRQVDPDGILEPEVREKLATSARRAWMAEIALKAAKARRARKSGFGGAA